MYQRSGVGDPSSYVQYTSCIRVYWLFEMSNFFGVKQPVLQQVYVARACIRGPVRQTALPIGRGERQISSVIKYKSATRSEALTCKHNIATVGLLQKRTTEEEKQERRIGCRILPQKKKQEKIPLIIIIEGPFVTSISSLSGGMFKKKKKNTIKNGDGWPGENA